jgi:hypothetical protein
LLLVGKVLVELQGYAKLTLTDLDRMVLCSLAPMWSPMH